MDAHYDSQIKSHNHPTAQPNATFCGPARQTGAGAGGLGAFAMRMGSVAIPVVRKFILPVAKRIGKNLLEAAIPEISQVLAGRKRPNSKMLKHVAETAAEKSLPKSRSVLSGGAPRRVARNGGGRSGDALFVHHHRRHLYTNHRRQSFPKENPWREVGRTFCLIFSLFNSKTIEKTTQQAFWIY